MPISALSMSSGLPSRTHATHTILSRIITPTIKPVSSSALCHNVWSWHNKVAFTGGSCVILRRKRFLSGCLYNRRNLKEILPACRAVTLHGPKEFCIRQSRLIKAASTVLKPPLSYNSVFLGNALLDATAIRVVLNVHARAELSAVSPIFSSLETLGQA